MCERLLNLQEIYVSGQNICIEVYGNSVGTITPVRLSQRFLDHDSIQVHASFTTHLDEPNKNNIECVLS